MTWSLQSSRASSAPCLTYQTLITSTLASASPKSARNTRVRGPAVFVLSNRRTRIDLTEHHPGLGYQRSNDIHLPLRPKRRYRTHHHHHIPTRHRPLDNPFSCGLQHPREGRADTGSHPRGLPVGGHSHRHRSLRLDGDRHEGPTGCGEPPAVSH